MVTALNYLHPLLLPEDHDEWLVSCFDNQVDIHNNLFDKVLALKSIYNPSHSEIADGAEYPFENNEDVSVFTDSCFVSEFHELLNSSRIPYQEYNNSNYMLEIESATLLHAPIGIKGVNGALPVIGMPLKSSLLMDDEKSDAVIGELLSDVIVAPLDNLLTILNDSLCIGPLRHIPDANYQPNPYPSQADWYEGKACWDELLTTDLMRDTSINEWLIDKDKLNLGYKVVYKAEILKCRYISPSTDINSLEDAMAIYDAIGDNLQMTISKANLENNPEAFESPVDKSTLEELRLSNRFSSDLYVGRDVGKQVTATLWDIHNNIDVSASDIGVGVSQLLPLVVAVYSRDKGIIGCEQPELHVHPRVQVAIGDLLTQAGTNAGFLIETHSEHLVLRMLKRIRQTTAGELPDGIAPVTTEDISIVYLEPSEDGVLARKFGVTGDGDFDEDWPGGFFDERDEELF
ncbi:AAA family ATPase [Shewanella halifaxensis]|nr:AAA family ATPase [Shewanella halifaxensis]